MTRYVPKVLLIDDDLGQRASAQTVGQLLGASKVISAENDEVLWSRQERIRAPVSVRGIAAFDDIEVYVSTGQRATRVRTENSLEVVYTALSKGWPKLASHEQWRWALVILDLTFISTPPNPDIDRDFGYTILRSLEERNLCPGLSFAILSDREEREDEASAARAGGKRVVVLLPKSEPTKTSARLRQIMITNGLIPDTGGDLVGLSLPWLSTLRAARARAGARASLIRGSQGSGKDGLSRYMHDWSERRGAFAKVPLSAGASEPQIVAICGSTGGTATGLLRSVGVFERLATNGTVFLDEIHNAAMEIQERLLEILEHDSDGSYYVRRVGTTEPTQIDPWAIAATNVSQDEMLRRLEQGSFRADLYERLSGDQAIVLPSLCERIDDVPALVRHFVRTFDEKEARSRGVDPSEDEREISQDTIEAVCNFVVSSNDHSLSVRWLRNLVGDAVGGYFHLRTLLPQHLQFGTLPTATVAFMRDEQAFNQTLTPRSAIDVLRRVSVDVSKVPFTDLHGVLGELERAWIELSAAVYVHALDQQAQKAGMRKAVVKKLVGNDSLEGTQISDQLLAWGIKWSELGLIVPEDVKNEIAGLYKTRYRKDFPGWSSPRTTKRSGAGDQ